MFELFYMGGPLFMGILTLLFLVMIILSVSVGWKIISKKELSDQHFIHTSSIKGVGLLAMVIGILGQLIGLYSAFVAIEQMKEISPAMLAGGIKVSMITTLYGVFIYIISLILWLILKGLNKKSD